MNEAFGATLTINARVAWIGQSGSACSRPCLFGPRSFGPGPSHGSRRCASRARDGSHTADSEPARFDSPGTSPAHSGRLASASACRSRSTSSRSRSDSARAGNPSRACSTAASRCISTARACADIALNHTVRARSARNRATTPTIMKPPHFEFHPPGRSRAPPPAHPGPAQHQQQVATADQATLDRDRDRRRRAAQRPHAVPLGW
jgi:hypothetical protein